MQLWMIDRDWQWFSQCVYVYIVQYVDQSMFICLLCLDVDERLGVNCIDVCFESDRLPAKNKIFLEENLWSSLLKPTTTPSLALLELRSALKIMSASFARGLVLDIKVKKGSVPKMANFETIFLSSLDKHKLIFDESTLKTVLN